MTHAVKEAGLQTSERTNKNGVRGRELWVSKHIFVKPLANKQFSVFTQHILPRAFVRIRHYGILSGTGKTKAIPLIRQQLPASLTPVVVPLRQLLEYNPLLCPCCKTETMVLLQVLPQRGPPKGLKTQQSYSHSDIEF